MERWRHGKIELVYDAIFYIILIIIGIHYHSEIAFAWKLADNKIAFIIHVIDYLILLSVWTIPLNIIKLIYFAVKKKARKALYELVSIPIGTSHLYQSPERFLLFSRYGEWIYYPFN